MTGEPALPGHVVWRVVVRGGVAAVVASPFVAGLGAQGIAVTGFIGAAVAGGAIVERLVVVRSWRVGRSPWRCALEAGLASAAVHAAAILNAVCWLTSPGVDLQERMVTLGRALHGRDGAAAAFVALALGWLAATPTGALAFAERSRGPEIGPQQPAPSPEPVLRWLLVWCAPLGALLGLAVAVGRGNALIECLLAGVVAGVVGTGTMVVATGIAFLTLLTLDAVVLNLVAPQPEPGP